MKNIKNLTTALIVAIMAVLLVIDCEDSRNLGNSKNTSHKSIMDSNKSNDVLNQSSVDSSELNTPKADELSKIAQLSLNEVYLDYNPKPPKIIYDKIDFWDKVFFTVWGEGFKHNGKDADKWGYKSLMSLAVRCLAMVHMLTNAQV